MRLLKIIILIALILLSLSAGAAKIMQMPQEIEFFDSANLSAALLIPLGIIQVLGSLGAIIPKTRIVGLGLIAFGFLASSLVIVMTGNFGFAAVSLIPVLLAIFLVRKPIPPRQAGH